MEKSKRQPLKPVEKITMADPWITEHEIKTVENMMRTGWDNFWYVETFQKEFAAYHGRGFGIMTPNCTQAIHLILLALGVKAGDEVIAPDCTWTGSVAGVTYIGATPVFCDIDERTWCLDPVEVEKRITKKTKAIIAVDLYGNMPVMEELERIAKEHNIFLIEDSAEALGSVYKGRKAGSFGIASVFSFHRTKTLTTGEGGMLVVDDKNLFERAMFLRDRGMDPKRPYYILEPAVKYMPSNLAASLGYAQFERINELVERKREILHTYKKYLEDIPDLQLNHESEDLHNGAWAPSLVFGKSHSMTRDVAMEKLKEMGLPTRPFFYPLSSLPAYSKYNTGDAKRNPVTYDVSARGITLPASFGLTDEQMRTYSNGIRSILGYPAK